MDKEIYLIDRRGENDDWEFVAAFKDSKSANDYLDLNYPGETSTVVPCDLPEKFITFFDQYKYCGDCDKYPFDNKDKICYLVEVNHTNNRHFDCIIVDERKALDYLKGKDGRIVTLKLPYHKNKFFNELALIKERKREADHMESVIRSQNIDRMIRIENNTVLINKSLFYLFIMMSLTFIKSCL